MKRLHLPSPLSLIGTLFLLAVGVGAMSCKGSRSPGAGGGAPPLFAYGDLDKNGNFVGISNDSGPVYRPYYQTGEMSTPRYMHQAIRLKNGLILVVGGTDERGFSTLDSAEIFDATSVRKGERIPPSKVGTWIDTDFAGNPIAMEFRRLWHTMNLLPDNRVIVIGGAANWLRARPEEKVEVFDPETRTFSTLEDAKLTDARVRHTSSFLPDGTILVAGGQIHDIFTDLFQFQVQGGGFQGGTVTQQIQTDIFPSVPEVEVFSFRDLIFTGLTLADNASRPSRLTSTRGRAGQYTLRIGGPDNRLGTGDDLFFLLGGFQTPTPSSGLVGTILVPRQAMNTAGVRNIEVYDPASHVFSQIGTAIMRYVRVNNPQATTFGDFNERTPDGVPGLANCFLVTHGDNNAGCWEAVPEDEVFTATFSGQGPANGLVINRIAYSDLTTNAHLIGFEAAVAIGLTAVPPAIVPEVPTLPPHFPGRSMTNIVPVPRRIESSRPGESTVGSWVFAGGGAHVFCTPNGPVAYYDGTVGSGQIFDPYYRLIPDFEFTLTPAPSARDLKSKRDETVNPTGIVGSWLALDGKYPSTTRVGFGDTPFSYTPGTWPHVLVNRMYPQNLALAGEDDVYDTVDDRILMSGGGQDAIDLGGEASEPASEIVILPKSP